MGKTSELHIKIQDELCQSITDAENGEISFLDALIELEGNKKQLDFALSIIKQFKDDQLFEIQNEADQFKDGYRDHLFEVRSGGAMYNYKHIKEWKTYKKALADCEARHKQAFMAMQKGLLTASADGEEMELPKVTYRKSSVIVKKK